MRISRGNACDGQSVATVSITNEAPDIMMNTTSNRLLNPLRK